MKSSRHDIGEYVYRAGEIAIDIYYIIKGKIGFETLANNTYLIFNEVGEGYYFGETDLLLYNRNQRTRQYTVKCL